MIQTFKRYELKYRIDGEQWNNLIPVLQKHMNLDEYCQSQGSYKIYNIYFDNDTDEIIRHSLTKPYYKEKLRLRSYQIPLRADDPIFFEIKKKIGGVVNKRRAITTLSQAIRLSEHGLISIPNEYQNQQVLAEIQKFIWRYQAKPKVFLSYERVAYFEKGNLLKRIKTTEFGSLFELSYDIQLDPSRSSKEFIDRLRTLNGNLQISLTMNEDERNKL